MPATAHQLTCLRLQTGGYDRMAMAQERSTKAQFKVNQRQSISSLHMAAMALNQNRRIDMKSVQGETG